MMVRNPVELRAGVMVEELGDDLIVMVPGSTDAVVLSGEPANIIRSLRAGRTLPGSGPYSELVDMGVLKFTSSVSRRSVLRVSAVGVGAGIALFSMPSVAVAASQQEAQEVALTFVDRNQTSQDGARYVVQVAVRLPLDFSAPLADPVPISARIGTDLVPSNFVTLFGNDRTDWYITAKPPHLLFWDVSTALGGGSGWLDTDGEVLFTWGTTTYRATGAVTAVLGLAPPS
jgi:hypothetical protein